MLNVSHEEGALNKNMAIAKLFFCKKELEKLHFCGNVINDSPDSNFEHADLESDASINIDNLDGQSKDKVKEFLENNKDVLLRQCSTCQVALPFPINS